MKLLQGEPTHVFSVRASQQNIKELDIQLELLEAKLKEIPDGDEMGNEPKIIDVNGEPTP